MVDNISFNGGLYLLILPVEEPVVLVRYADIGFELVIFSRMVFPRRHNWLTIGIPKNDAVVDLCFPPKTAVPGAATGMPISLPIPSSL